MKRPEGWKEITKAIVWLLAGWYILMLPFDNMPVWKQLLWPLGFHLLHRWYHAYQFTHSYEINLKVEEVGEEDTP